jgi:hypothetical protein
MKMLFDAAINPQKKNTSASDASAPPFVLIFASYIGSLIASFGWLIVNLIFF